MWQVCRCSLECSELYCKKRPMRLRLLCIHQVGQVKYRCNNHRYIPYRDPILGIIKNAFTNGMIISVSGGI